MQTEYRKRTPSSKALPCRVDTFESFTDFLEFVASQPEGAVSAAQKEFLSRGPMRGSGFYHGTWPQAMERAHHGWPEGRELVDTITAKFESITANKIMRPTVAYDVSGDCVDVGRYVTGEPENMMVFEEVETEGPGKILRMHVNLAASCSISCAQMAIRGAAACALVDALESCGKRVELWVTMGQAWKCADPSSNLYEFAVPVKLAEEPVEMDRLAFMLAYPDMLRRLGFAAMENLDPERRTRLSVPGHYAYPSEAQYLPPADITVPQMLLTSTPEACVMWVLKTLKEQGINIEGI